jgi:hypothetical protein
VAEVRFEQAGTRACTGTVEQIIHRTTGPQTERGTCATAN